MSDAFQTEGFIGREKEGEILEKAYLSKKTEFIPVYGRRRVGKSELILHFIKDKHALYFLGKKATPQLQLQEFMREAARSLANPLLTAVKPAGWEEALRLVMTQKKSPKKWILVLDEFQWMVQASPELPSILQGFLDTNWKKRGDILLIVCGSYMGFMEREILGEKSPLFGRRTAQIFLKPFSYRDAALFHPSWSLADRARAYFICGGIPLYLRFFSEKTTLAKNIEKNLLDEYAPLFREPDFLLREELRELQKYYAILMCLSTGSETGKEIAAKTGIDDRKIYYYLEHLIQLGYVARSYPLTLNKPTQKEVHFVLEDPLLYFWFRFIYPNNAYICQVGSRESFMTLVRPQLESFFGLRFEKLCREALPYLYQKEGVNTPFEVGAYWDAETQIDVVGHRKKEGFDLGECKWGDVRSLTKVAEELDKKIKKYPNDSNLSIRGRIFLKNPPSRKSRLPFSIHSLQELYE